ncbi:ATP-binding cassette domain-containing protein [bacterium]|nr:ATP-binding cassette domain-containing protein [bacterium]
MLRIEGVSKSYGTKVAIRDISFEVPDGSTFGLLGPNGAGKTSLIRIINQIQPADTGKVFFNNKPITEDLVNQIGYLPEERGLYKKMKVGEQVLYLARLKGMSKADAVREIKWWFDRLHITDWWNKKVETLSKGMQQKVQFIATVLHKPSLIILDEPFSGFDPVNAEIVKNELLRLKEDGATIMLSTHRMESVEELCDYVAMIHKSEKVLDGKIADVKRQFKRNEFEVKYRGEKLDTYPAEALQILHEGYDEEHEAQVVHIKMANDEHTNEVLTHFMSQRQVIGFGEILPGIEEIFVNIAKN